MKKHEHDLEIKDFKASVVQGLGGMFGKNEMTPRSRKFVTSTDEPLSELPFHDRKDSVYCEPTRFDDTIELGRTVWENDQNTGEHEFYGTHLNETDVPQSLL